MAFRRVTHEWQHGDHYQIEFDCDNKTLALYRNSERAIYVYDGDPISIDNTVINQLEDDIMCFDPHSRTDAKDIAEAFDVRPVY